MKQKEKNTNLLNAHLKSVDEGYFEHMGHALRFSRRMFAGGAACLLHAVFPFAFASTGSEAIKQLHTEMVDQRKGLTRLRSEQKIARSRA